MITIRVVFFKFILLTLVVVVYFSCNSDSIYQKTEKLPTDSWAYGQSLIYHWNINDTANWYSMILKIEHSPNLNFRNQYVKCITSFPDSSKKEQVLSLELFNESGKPYGKCSSSKCNTEISLIAKTKFQFQGEYGLTIEQYGRDSVIKGLRSFELDISKIKL